MKTEYIGGLKSINFVVMDRITGIYYWSVIPLTRLKKKLREKRQLLSKALIKKY